MGIPHILTIYTNYSYKKLIKLSHWETLVVLHIIFYEQVEDTSKMEVVQDCDTSWIRKICHEESCTEYNNLTMNNLTMNWMQQLNNEHPQRNFSRLINFLVACYCKPRRIWHGVSLLYILTTCHLNEFEMIWVRSSPTILHWGEDPSPVYGKFFWTARSWA